MHNSLPTQQFTTDLERELTEALKIVCGPTKMLTQVLNFGDADGDTSMIMMKVAQLIPEITANPDKFKLNDPKFLEIVNKYGSSQT